jgi:hypothetical protein
MRSGKICNDPEYQLTGICNDFRACTHSHPWDDKAFGPVADVTATAKQGKAQKLHLDIAVGKVCSMAPANELIRMKMPETPLRTENPQPASNTEPRTGRGTISAAQQTFIEERASWLFEDIDQDDLQYAAIDDDLSNVTVDTS